MCGIDKSWRESKALTDVGRTNIWNNHLYKWLYVMRPKY